MSELTKEELQLFYNFCDDVISAPDQSQEICDHYTTQDSSFEYLFLFQRVKMSIAYGSKQLLKTIKEIKAELREAQQLEQQAEMLQIQQQQRLLRPEHAPIPAPVPRAPAPRAPAQRNNPFDDFVIQVQAQAQAVRQ